MLVCMFSCMCRSMVFVLSGNLIVMQMWMIIVCMMSWVRMRVMRFMSSITGSLLVCKIHFCKDTHKQIWYYTGNNPPKQTHSIVVCWSTSHHARASVHHYFSGIYISYAKQSTEDSQNDNSKQTDHKEISKSFPSSSGNERSTAAEWIAVKLTFINVYKLSEGPINAIDNTRDNKQNK